MKEKQCLKWMGKYNTKANTENETDILVKRDQDVCPSGLVTIKTNVEGLLGSMTPSLNLELMLYWKTKIS